MVVVECTFGILFVVLYGLVWGVRRGFFSFVFCCCCFEIVGNFWIRGSAFFLCVGFYRLCSRFWVLGSGGNIGLGNIRRGVGFGGLEVSVVLCIGVSVLGCSVCFVCIF